MVFVTKVPLSGYYFPDDDEIMYTRHTSSCRCVGCPHSPRSLTDVSSREFPRLPPSCNSNYFGYN
ncbi:hypothetical protein DF213_04080 [Dickeya dianthicola]|uniref:Uncharacterized protein n=1 Tax=Dickeya dianthicola TaxID=204039 RepID=A0AAX1C9H8_9GAMM|nr:hypothetical protein DF213_04080 [Dickeya dianthicola]